MSLAIRIRNLGIYVGPRLDVDGPERPREAFRVLAQIAGFRVNLDGEGGVQRTVAVAGHVLRDLNLDIEQGSVVCLTGPSGCGKSVLLKILGGVIPPTSGTAELWAKPRTLVQLGANINEQQSAIENIRDADGYDELSPAEAGRFEADVIEFAGLRGFEHAPLRTYSTGMEMRLSVAMALCGTPSLVLIDDVLTVGDIGFQQQVLDRVQALAQHGCTIVAAISDEALVEQVATRVVTLGGGRVVSDTPTALWHVARSGSTAADVTWDVIGSLPEDDVMCFRDLAVSAVPTASGLMLRIAMHLKAKVGDVRCRPSVFVMREKVVVCRSLYPEFIALDRPHAFTCRVDIPIALLGSGDYRLTLSVQTIQSPAVFSMKAEAIAVTIRHADAAASPSSLLAVQLPWEIERLAGKV